MCMICFDCLVWHCVAGLDWSIMLSDNDCLALVMEKPYRLSRSGCNYLNMLVLEKVPHVCMAMCMYVFLVCMFLLYLAYCKC